MNSAGKPKGAKLWKNSGFPLKKEKQEKQTLTFDVKVKSKKFDSPLNKSKEFKNRPNKKHKKRQSDQRVVKDEKVSIKTVANAQNQNSVTDIKNKTPHQQSKKRKNEFQDSGTKKRIKPDDMKRKDWKMLHMDKKDKVSAHGESAVKSEKVVPKTTKEWKKLNKKLKGKSEVFELGETLKNLWNEFRREDCEADKKKQLVKRTCGLIKGRVKEFTFAHDTVRVLECVVMEGSDADRTLLFDELKNDILVLAKSKYGKFFLLKMLRYGSKEQKDVIMKTFHGQIIKLIRHTEAAEVIELAFNECANAKQRFEFVQEFYGPTYMYFKTNNLNTLKELFENDPSKKNAVINNMKEELIKILDKTVVKHSIVHHILWQFMQYCDPASKSEVIESLKEAVPEILHTKDGSRVGMHCVWFGTAKDRKAIIKSMKTHLLKIAMEEHGHMVLLALFDCFDDTKFLAKKCITGELEKNLLEVSQNVHGKKVLIYLLNPRDPHYIHPDVINILKTGDGNKNSKKDVELRRSELKAAIATPLLKLINDNIANLYKDNAFCLFTLVILQHTVGDRKEAYQAIADLAVEPYTTENKNTHVIEHSGSNFLLKQLIIHESHTNCPFSEVLIDKVPKYVFKSWIECNRGAFLLVSLLETQLPTVIERIKQDLIGCNKYLSKKSYKGAEILLKKLKD